MNKVHKKSCGASSFVKQGPDGTKSQRQVHSNLSKSGWTLSVSATG